MAIPLAPCSQYTDCVDHIVCSPSLLSMPDSTGSYVKCSSSIESVETSCLHYKIIVQLCQCRDTHVPVEQAALRRCILHGINQGNRTDSICIIHRATMWEQLSGKFSKMRICTRRMLLFVHAASHCGCINVVSAKQTTMAVTHHFLDLVFSYLRPFTMLKMKGS